MATTKLPDDDPRWGTIPQLWGVPVGSRGVAHRISKVAAPDNALTYHAVMACGTYLTRIAAYSNPPHRVDFCDACLLDNTLFHAVYVYTAPCGECIYVGYTADLPTRIGHHRSTSPWWTPSLSLSYTIYPSEEEGLKAESAAIVARKPTNNSRVSAGTPIRGSRKLSLYARADVLQQLIAEKLGVPADSLSAANCADFLGVSHQTFWRLRTDSEYAIGSSCLAHVFVAFDGQIPDGLLEARPPRRLGHLAIAA